MTLKIAKLQNVSNATPSKLCSLYFGPASIAETPYLGTFFKKLFCLVILIHGIDESILKLGNSIVDFIHDKVKS